MVQTHTQVAVIVEPGRVELKTVRVPDPEPHEVLTRTLLSGISVGTERHYITGAYGRMGDRVSTSYPFATGYQRCAVVERVGGAVEDLAVGDRVLVGRSRLLEPDIQGAAGHIGYGVVDTKDAYRFEADTDAEEAALWVMAGVGLHGARMSRIGQGETVAVIGLGMIGQMAAQAARIRGAQVLATDRSDHRAAIAAAHSADRVHPGNSEDFATAVLSDFPDGVDVVVDTGSRVDAWSTCMRLVRREGRINLQGYYPGAFEIDSHAAHVNRVTAVFPSGYDDPATVADLLGQQRFKIQPLITHRFLASEVRSAFDLVIRSPQKIIGGVIDWRNA